MRINYNLPNYGAQHLTLAQDKKLGMGERFSHGMIGLIEAYIPVLSRIFTIADKYFGYKPPILAKVSIKPLDTQNANGDFVKLEIRVIELPKPKDFSSFEPQMKEFVKEVGSNIAFSREVSRIGRIRQAEQAEKSRIAALEERVKLLTDENAELKKINGEFVNTIAELEAAKKAAPIFH